jgi:hypothetical protein
VWAALNARRSCACWRRPDPTRPCSTRPALTLATTGSPGCGTAHPALRSRSCGHGSRAEFASPALREWCCGGRCESTSASPLSERRGWVARSACRVSRLTDATTLERVGHLAGGAVRIDAGFSCRSSSRIACITAASLIGCSMSRSLPPPTSADPFVGTLPSMSACPEPTVPRGLPRERPATRSAARKMTVYEVC